MRILIATDGSACSTRALACAAKLAPHHSDVVAVVSVAQVIPSLILGIGPAGAIQFDSFQEAAEARARAALEVARSLLEGYGIDAAYHFREGEPVDAILHTAETFRPDMLVVGSHGLGSIDRILFGSVSGAVLHRWPGPVLVVREASGTCEPAAPRRLAVRDVMSCTLVVAKTDMPIALVARMMRVEEIGAVPVVEGDRLVGVITDRDLVVRAMALDLDPATVTAGDICTHGAETLTPDLPLTEAAHQMERNQVQRMPVVADGRLVGMVSVSDLAAVAPACAEDVLVTISRTRKARGRQPQRH